MSEAFQEDLIANAILGIAMLVFVCAKDLCKRVSRSDCVLDQENGLRIKLPTFRDEPTVQDV